MPSTLTAERVDRKDLIYLHDALHFMSPHCHHAHQMVVPLMLLPLHRNSSINPSSLDCLLALRV